MKRRVDNERGGRSGASAAEELSIRFVNTVAWRRGDAPEERLPSPAALLDWYGAAGIAGPAYCARLKARWNRRPREARIAYWQALALREAIYRIFRHERTPKQALQLLNATLGKGSPGLRLAPTGHAYGWRPSSSRASPADM